MHVENTQNHWQSTESMTSRSLPSWVLLRLAGSTSVTQPVDVAIFRTFKNEMANAVGTHFGSLAVSRLVGCQPRALSNMVAGSCEKTCTGLAGSTFCSRTCGQ
eukprot:6474139-Amphidinium_carterae.1